MQNPVIYNVFNLDCYFVCGCFRKHIKIKIAPPQFNGTASGPDPIQTMRISLLLLLFNNPSWPSNAVSASFFASLFFFGSDSFGSGIINPRWFAVCCSNVSDDSCSLKSGEQPRERGCRSPVQWHILQARISFPVLVSSVPTLLQRHTVAFKWFRENR